ncbi:MAG TPA: hypothetical protein VKX46_02275 [Ktedonobacteraceae bacterium]|nr:hypothetical protein [Ktedonobacteraceae bacterium]
MNDQFSETNKPYQRKMADGNLYSAHIQEAMRQNKLPSADYGLVMTILHAVLQGYTREQWYEEQQKSLKLLASQPPDQKAQHADVANRYEQTVSRLKDLTLWPW